MSDQRLISDGSWPIVGDLDRIKQYQLTSNGTHTIRIREESLVPWLSYLRQWNAANAYNLALMSSAAYLQQETVFHEDEYAAGKLEGRDSGGENQLVDLFSD